VRTLLADDLVATSRVTEGEIASALARRCREGELAEADRDRALGALRQDMGSLFVVEVTAAVSQRSVALLKRHPLRAADALQLKETPVTEIIFLVQESPEGGYEAKAASESIFTEADTLEELRAMVRDAVSCHFEAEDRPKLIRLHVVREEVIAA
jgi:hypothetical protein